DLTSPVDDSHAPTSNLFQQLIVPEVADTPEMRVIPGLGWRLGLPTQRFAEPRQLVVGGEEGTQVVGQVGMVSHQFVAVRCSAGSDGFQIAGDQVVEALFTLRRNR